MKALTFTFNYGRLAAAKLLGAFSSRGYLSGLGPIGYEDVPDPRLLADDWVILKTRYCGICGSDVKQVFLDGARDNPLTSFITFPHVMGHEVLGVVEETGPAVSDLQRGDRVIAYPWLTCEARGLPLCDACEAGRLTFCRNFTRGDLAAGMHYGTCRDVSGGFAPLVPAHRSMCFKVPDGVSTEQAALADPFAVSLHAVLKAPPKPGATVLVVGCGALGMMVIHIVSRLFDGVNIVAVDRHEHLRPMAEQLGATTYLTLGGRDLIEAVAEMAEARVHNPMSGLPWLLAGVDAVYDTVGSARTLETDLRLVQPGGTVVVVGVATPARFEWTPLYFKEVNLVGASGCGMEEHDGRRSHGFSMFLDLLDKGRVSPEPLITHTFQLDQYRDAFVAAREKRTHRSVKVLFDFEERL